MSRFGCILTMLILKLALDSKLGLFSNLLVMSMKFKYEVHKLLVMSMKFQDGDFHLNHQIFVCMSFGIVELDDSTPFSYSKP